MLKSIFNSWSYLVWYAFYFILLTVLTAGGIIPTYIILFILAFRPVSERLWRWVTGIRPLRIKAEKERLLPLFEEVYTSYAEKENSTHTRKIKLYIQESMSIGAFAFGRETLVLTKGSIDLLSDDALKGLIAHELAHFHNYDTMAILFSYVANFPISFLIKKLRQVDSTLNDGFIKFLFSIIYALFRLLEFISDLIIMHQRRKSEYQADFCALRWGYGEELTGALIQMYQISMEKPKSIGDMVRGTHPPITKRIERLEMILSSE